MRADSLTAPGAAAEPFTLPDWEPVLPAQHGMILNYLRFPDDGVDIIQVTVDWKNPIERAPFEAVWRLLARRHPILRTVFRIDGDGLAQAVVPRSVIDIRWRDLPPAPASGPDLPFESFLLADRRERFDLIARPAVRVTVLRRTGEAAGDGDVRAYRSVLTFHHALLDGRSMRLLLEEAGTAYTAGGQLPGQPPAGQLPGQPSAGQPPAGQPAPQPGFGEYVRWWHATGTPGAEQFWSEYLAGTVLPRPLPGYLGAGLAGTAEPVTAHAVLSRSDSDLIRQAAAAAGLKSSTMVSAAWALLRARYGGTSDVVLAVTRSGRPGSIPGADNIFGPLINTVPLRVRIDESWSVRELLAAVNQGIQQIRAYQRTPIGDALTWAGLAADTTLMDSLLMFDRQRMQTGLPDDTAPVSVRVDRLPSYPVTLLAYDEPEIRLSLIWDRTRFAEGSGQRMLDQLRATLIEFASKLAEPLVCLDLGRAAEREVLAGWNRTSSGYPADATAVTLFAAQVARDPDATAVIFGSASMTYAELDRRTSALAWLLRRRGVSTDTPVGVAISRGMDLVVALLAVLKAGGAYLPIDTASPPPRVRAMLAAADARLLLVTAHTQAAMSELPGVELIGVDSAAGGETEPPPDASHPLSLAYISFTSGSTGVPKGVGVPHRGVVRLISHPNFGNLGPGDRVLHLSPAAFDLTTLEIWGALLTGGAVVVAPPPPLSLSDIAALLRNSGVTVIWLTSGLFDQLAETDIDAIAGVPLVLAGGDALNPAAVRAVLAARRGRPLVNGYGPTENTTFTTCYVMTDPGQVGLTVPIGGPVQDTTAAVFGTDGRPALIGVTGELLTGGDGLARGYAGNAAATARVFVPDPAGHGTRLYRTGDLARWRADGILEFAGRVDDQVKIRGFRVEPGEVAAVLRSHPGVREAVVLVAGEGAQRHLIGYVTPADGVELAELRPSVLRDFAAQRLPDYLVPVGFKALDRLPLNANGKVARAALPSPDRETGGQATPPRGATEERLAEIWRQLLPEETTTGGAVGQEDSFFALGGNSLSAARMTFRIREVFGVDLPMASFYEAPTLAGSAAAIDAARSGATKSGISRRDRSAYRVAAAEPERGRPARLAPHLVRLTDDWAFWRTVCLRGAGFPNHLLESLADPSLAGAADAVLAAGAGTGGDADDRYAAEFPAAVGRLTAALHAAASMPALREAVAWQNRHGLATGIDVLRRHGPQPVKRNTNSRQHEALVASYLQRYCGKNDTIGFFGPVGWAELDDGPGVRITHADPGRWLAARVTYLEGWAVREALAGYQGALRPWLVPRRMPFVGIDGAQLRLPLAPPVPLTPAELAVMRACDGRLNAIELAEVVLADPAAGLADAAEVFEVLGRLADSHRLAWQVELAPHDIRPEHTMSALLAGVTDDDVRESAQAALDELTAARDELAAATGDAEQVAAAMAGLESVFTRLAGAPPTRRAGELYAGRTLAYEECLRGDTLALGVGALDGIRAALGLVLDSARWFTAECAAEYTQVFDEEYRKRAAALGTDVVPFADLWLIINETLFDQPPKLLQPPMRALRERWSAIFDLQPGARQVQFRAADLSARVAAQFPVRPLPWPMAVHHSPDILIAGSDAASGGPLTWVLGEIHPSIVTMRYATWVEFHESPEAIQRAIRRDFGGPVVWMAESGEQGGTCTRLANVLPAPGDIRLVSAHDSLGYDQECLMVGDCDVIATPAGLRVRRRDGSFERDLLQIIGDLLSAAVSHCFDVVPPAEHVPRVAIDDLVVCRERWLLPAADPAFASNTDERARYLQAREWAVRHGLPRYVFMRFTGERKPIYADLTSLASIDLISRSLRRSRRQAGDDAMVNVVEMLPTPDQAWLTDAEGQRYSAELRMVAVDQLSASQWQGG